MVDWECKIGDSQARWTMGQLIDLRAMFELIRWMREAGVDWDEWIDEEREPEGPSNRL